MTIREIADTAGCSEKSVKRIVADLWPAKMEHGKVTRFSLEEANKLMTVLPKKNMVSNSGQMSSVGAGDRMDRLEALVEKLLGAVVALSVQAPRLAIAAPQVKPRDHVNQIVRRYADRSGMDFSTAWRDLYREFRGMGVLDYLEAEGLIETLEAVALEWAK
jgi:hypothetical protein